jgi:hypothetical protein
VAGDWIKIDISTPDKPEIDRMATILKLDHDSVVGKCIRVWIWADLQSVDGNALSVTETFLDRLTYCPGFSEALRQVGWLTGREGRLSIPNFDRHNGQTAKNRALTSKRVKKSRNAETVTKSLPEKRREEKSISLPSDAKNPDVFVPEKMQTPEVQEAAALWWSHLRLEHPDKVPEPNSPQLQAFWNDANRMGPRVFIDAVNLSAKNRWATLRERPENEQKGSGNGKSGSPSGSSTADREKAKLQRILSGRGSEAV